jgi:hypothetical protein
MSLKLDKAVESDAKITQKIKDDGAPKPLHLRRSCIFYILQYVKLQKKE